MENFKINRFEDQDRKQKISEFQTLSLEHLNRQSYISQEQLQDAKKAHEATKDRTHEEVLKIYEQVGESHGVSQEAKGGILEKIEISGRDSSGIIHQQNHDENIIYLSHYRAKFTSYGGRDDFMMRADQHQTRAQLDENIDQVKGSPREVSLGQKLLIVMKAVGLRKAA
ncbi:MAG: hypothetical protein Q4A23_01585 [bacterium]|nr:hypothetical protein [bacterium]